MREAFQNMFTVLDKLLRDQLSNYPDIVRECIGGVLRYGLLTLCIFAGVLAVALLYSLCAKKKSMRVLVAQGATLALCVILLIWAFLPVSLAQTGKVEAARLQTVIYRDAATVRAEKAAAESAAQAEAGAESDADADASSGANSTSEDQEEEEEEPVTGLVAVITNTQELTAAQAQAVLALLEAQKGVRTVRAKLPEQSRSTLVLRFEDGESRSVSLLEDSGYYYITETSDFLYSITDYDAFSAALRAIVQ